MLQATSAQMSFCLLCRLDVDGDSALLQKVGILSATISNSYSTGKCALAYLLLESRGQVQ